MLCDREVLRKEWARFVADEDGQTMVEYALLVNILTLAILLTARIMGRRVVNAFNRVANAIS